MMIGAAALDTWRDLGQVIGAGLVPFSESAYSWILISSMTLAFTITFKQLIVSVGIQASTAASKVQATLALR